MKKVSFTLLLSVFLSSSCSEDRDLSLSKAQLSEDSNKTITYGKAGINNILTSYDLTEGEENIFQINSIGSDVNEDVNELFEGLVVTVNLEEMKAYIVHEYEEGEIQYDLDYKEDGSLGLTNPQVFSKTNPRWLCAAGCVAQGFAISLWDGPAPFMDLAAAAYTLVCAKDCKK